MIREYRFFCKDYASERNESLLSNCRMQHILCKDNIIIRCSLHKSFPFSNYSVQRFAQNIFKR